MHEVTFMTLAIHPLHFHLTLPPSSLLSHPAPHTFRAKHLSVRTRRHTQHHTSSTESSTCTPTSPSLSSLDIFSSMEPVVQQQTPGKGKAVVEAFATSPHSPCLGLKAAHFRRYIEDASYGLFQDVEFLIHKTCSVWELEELNKRVESELLRKEASPSSDGPYDNGPTLFNVFMVSNLQRLRDILATRLQVLHRDRRTPGVTDELFTSFASKAELQGTPKISKFFNSTAAISTTSQTVSPGGNLFSGQQTVASPSFSRKVPSLSRGGPPCRPTSPVRPSSPPASTPFARLSYPQDWIHLVTSARESNPVLLFPTISTIHDTHKLLGLVELAWEEHRRLDMLPFDVALDDVQATRTCGRQVR